MDNYIVSARKYRPMTFDSVVGQSALTTTLKNAVKSGKLAHAYLFCGPRGVGKTTCARIFAKAINCMSPTEEGEACNHCESCISFNEQRSYNIFELDAASNNSVENIKTLMEQTRIPPQVGKYKVFIIDEVHMLSTQAFNAFLKTLEEPPAHVIFILATTEKHKILPTIISRCQIYDFERMTVQSIINHLKMVAEKENVTYEEEALAVIAEKADGGMRDALSIFDQAVSFCQGNITYEKVIEDLNVLDSNYYFNIIDLALENKVTEIMVLLNSIIAKGFDGGNLVLGLASHVRNVLMARDEQTLPLLEVSQQQKQKYQEQAKKCTVPFLYKALKIMNQCDINYRQSNNKRLLVELTLIQIAQITQPDDDTSAGLSPKRLKSLFKKLTSTTLSKPAVQVAGTESIPVTRSRTKQQQEKEEVAPRKEIKIDTTPQPSNAPKLKLTSLMTTFGSLKNNEQKPVEQEETPTVSQEEQNKFSDEDLQLQWMMMCNRMPESMVGMASRMKNLIPRITNYPNVEVVVDNQILLTQLQGIKSRIKATLARDL
ncbi:MAG: DNA polymerase III subunit gamma/tau, partial [Prevotella sp.]|nr:DNA polymerase III subunit gamma/tau [Prevotella sp.]